MAKEKSQIAIVLAEINELQKRNLLPEDFRVTNFCYRQNQIKADDKGYIWIDGRLKNSAIFYHWEGIKGDIIYCTKYESSHNQVPIWDENHNRVRLMTYLKVQPRDELDIDMRNLEE